eukprot:747862-Hanusia_phi.AAC.14
MVATPQVKSFRFQEHDPGFAERGRPEVVLSDDTNAGKARRGVCAFVQGRVAHNRSCSRGCLWYNEGGQGEL